MFTAPLFWLVLLAGAALAQVIPATAVRARSILLSLASVLLLWRVIHLGAALMLLAGSIAWVIVGLRVTRSLAIRRSTAAALVVVAPLLAVWTLGKQALALDWDGSKWLAFVGVSYLLTKAWTLIKDVSDGRLSVIDPAVAVAYFLHFPAYVSGPMHTYQEFDGALRKPLPLDGEAIVDVAFRISLGFVKLRVLGPLFSPLSLAGVEAGEHLGALRIGTGCVAYSLVIWADFSGYSDVAIGSSRLLGIATPENFRSPYLAVNIRDFWQRWHITFSRVLTSYLFIPISRALLSWWPDRRRSVAAASTLITFLVCGYWHGPTTNFILWGLYHGAGLVVYDLYSGLPSVKAARRRNASRSRLRRSAGRFAAMAATFTFVSVGWIFFALPIQVFLGGRP